MMAKVSMVFSGFGLFLCLFCVSCASVSTEGRLESFKKEASEDNLKMSKLAEENLDDDLNKVEREDVKEIFQKDREEKKRMDDTVF